MIRFDIDYAEGMHPQILKRLQETNDEQTAGYGKDPYCESARQKIKKACGRDDIDVHFMVGGTQANVTVIAHLLRPYQGALSATTGHIHTHETGALEATGHKVLLLDHQDGKLSAESIRTYMEDYLALPNPEHKVEPKLVYLSQSTELGTLYSKEELKEIHELCQEYGLYLFIDGARLGYALASEENDLTLKDLTEFCDAFYIGGTKVGAMMGEAIIITNDLLKPGFRHMIKQNGNLLAKGRFLGLQFDSLFDENLYLTISKHAIDCANRIVNALRDDGYELAYPSPTNQIFPVLHQKQIDALKDKYIFQLWEKVDDDRSIIRLCTSWATKKENVDRLIEDLLQAR